MSRNHGTVGVKGGGRRHKRLPPQGTSRRSKWPTLVLLPDSGTREVYPGLGNIRQLIACQEAK